MKKMKTRLIVHRKVSGLSQKEVAQRLGVSPSAVCHLEKTGIRSMNAARRYAKILKCDPINLLS